MSAAQDPAEVPLPRRDPTRLEVWAPSSAQVSAVVDGQRLAMETLPGRPGWWGLRQRLRPGQRYGFSLDGADPLPDPRSISQPDGVHGLSEVIDPALLRRHSGWPGGQVLGGVLYELHIGTFSDEGTFDGAIAHLGQLAELGIDAVEVMPIADFPGQRGWGYDGVGLYSVHRGYGGPEGFARFIDAAHGHGLGVVLDVVYNHLGPEGNYLAPFGPYFTDRHATPWGMAVNLDGPASEEVRRFLTGSAAQWLLDFGVDALRLDAVHELRDDSERHFLAELAESVQAWSRQAGRPLTLIAESDRNQADTVAPVGSSPGALGQDSQWADDLHHAIHAFISGDQQGYYAGFGEAEQVRKALTNVFVYDGVHSPVRGTAWGAPVERDGRRYNGHSFVVCLQNHDQVGNRADGARIGALVEPGLQAAGAALILLSPFTPMLFEGEEWAASTPFPFFSELGPELDEAVREGRAREFAAFDWADVPDPQAEATFDSAVLDWGERGQPGHARMLAWYRRLISIRHASPEVMNPALASVRVDVVDADTLVLRRGTVAVAVTRAKGRDVVVDLGADAEPLASWAPARPLGGGRFVLSEPGALVVRPSSDR